MQAEVTYIGNKRRRLIRPSTNSTKHAFEQGEPMMLKQLSRKDLDYFLDNQDIFEVKPTWTTRLRLLPEQVTDSFSGVRDSFLPEKRRRNLLKELKNELNT